MHGNAYEWCDSWFDEDPQRIDDPNFVGSARVSRGGSWVIGAYGLRSACRNYDRPALTDINVGVRVARAVRKS